MMPFFNKKNKTECLGLFFRQLGSMLTAGIHLKEALDILSDDTENKEIKQLARDVGQDLLSGEVAPSVRESYPSWFRAFVAFVFKQGTVSQDLPGIMDSIADDYEAMEDLEARFISTLIYPVTTLFIAAIVTGVILIFVIPTFVEMFAAFGSGLPKPTLFVISLSSWFIRSANWVILVLLVGFLLLKYNKGFRDRVLILTPGIKTIIKTHSLIRFSRTLSLMLGVNAPVREALDVAADAVPNTVYSMKLKDALKQTENPLAVCDALERTGNYSKMAIRILRAGEKSSSLAQALKGLAQYYEKSKIVSIDQTMRIFEIMITLGVATLIGFLVVSMYLPIFKMAGAVGG